MENQIRVAVDIPHQKIENSEIPQTFQPCLVGPISLQWVVTDGHTVLQIKIIAILVLIFAHNIYLHVCETSHQHYETLHDRNMANSHELLTNVKYNF